VPQQVLEAKVTRYLKQSAVLGNGPFLIRECLARQALVDRLSRNFFGFDERIHGEVGKQAEEIRRQMAAGEMDTSREHPSRSVVDIAARQPGDDAEKAARGPRKQMKEGEPTRTRLTPEEREGAGTLAQHLTIRIAPTRQPACGF